MSTPLPGGKPGSKLAAKAGGKKGLLIAAATVTALVAFVMGKGGKGGSSGGGGGSDQMMMGYDSTVSDQYNDLQRQFEDLRDQIDSGQVTPGTPPTTQPTTPTSPKPPIKTLPWKPPHPTPPKIPGKTTLPAKVTKKYVTIKRGDTLSTIAKRAGISMTTLKKLNPNFWKNPKYHNGNTIWSGGKVRTK
ncbi:LysM domain-containing protein [Streptomyces sp. NPDC006173]|uniref:LysM peptidoglycan-binding domain-containing protein n=1 Tax=Streptomyces sp. NPDC006173 TaxID=3155349 RepID=UPI0033D66507